jgi:ADP-ribose pyrophosphatase
MKNGYPPTKRFALNLMLNEHDELLMLLRSKTASLGASQWGVPAGKIENGETPREAALREMCEEIGPGHLVKEIDYIGPVRDTYYGGQFEIHLFKHLWSAGNIILNKEHFAYAWVSKESICNYDVMKGIEEDIAILDIWPTEYLNQALIPKHLL